MRRFLRSSIQAQRDDDRLELVLSTLHAVPLLWIIFEVHLTAIDSFGFTEVSEMDSPHVAKMIGRWHVACGGEGTVTNRVKPSR